MDRRSFLRVPVGVGVSFSLIGSVVAGQQFKYSISQIFFPDEYSEKLFQAKFVTPFGSNIDLNQPNINLKSSSDKFSVYIESASGEKYAHFNNLNEFNVNMTEDFHLLVKSGSKCYYKKILIAKGKSNSPSNLNYISNKCTLVGMNVIHELGLSAGINFIEVV